MQYDTDGLVSSMRMNLLSDSMVWSRSCIRVDLSQLFLKNCLQCI